jgi:hypothetical protein
LIIFKCLSKMPCFIFTFKKYKTYMNNQIKSIHFIFFKLDIRTK